MQLSCVTELARLEWNPKRSCSSIKKVVISAEEGTNELAFLESVFRKLLNFEQVNVAISFQRYDPDFEEFVDLEEDDELRNLEKLNVVVTPVLVIPPEVSQVTIHACSTCLIILYQCCARYTLSHCTLYICLRHARYKSYHFLCMLTSNVHVNPMCMQ